MSQATIPPKPSSPERFRNVRVLLAFAAIIAALLGFGFFTRIPPQETKLIAQFQTHRAAYERLREMLQEENRILGVSRHGVRTTNLFFYVTASDADFPADRYGEYLALLKELGGLVAARQKGESANPSILLWHWGWAGLSRNIGISWEDHPPTNQVPTLKGHHGDYRDGEWVIAYRHIEGNWYLWTNL